MNSESLTRITISHRDNAALLSRLSNHGDVLVCLGELTDNEDGTISFFVETALLDRYRHLRRRKESADDFVARLIQFAGNRIS